jgi:crossover junction endodeoxyribonuclease RuvC
MSLTRTSEISNSIKILGIDPGSRVTGFAVLEFFETCRLVRHGVIQLSENQSFSYRLGELAQSMIELLDKYQPQQVSVEKIFLGKNADSAFKLGHARGVVMGECARRNCEVFEYATRVVKKSIAGSGAASKEQVQWALQKYFKIKNIDPIDASDALALAAHHALQLGTQRNFRSLDRVGAL